MPQVFDDAHVLCTTGLGAGQEKLTLGHRAGQLKPVNTDGVRVHGILFRSMDYRNLLYLTSKPAMETLDDMSRRALLLRVAPFGHHLQTA